jgi:hypothetical protein
MIPKRIMKAEAFQLRIWSRQHSGHEAQGEPTPIEGRDRDHVEDREHEVSKIDR